MTHLPRRDFLRAGALGFGALALDALRATDLRAADPLAPKPAHHKARAKRVIFLYAGGGPSQHDLFDFKPRLVRDHGGPPAVRPNGREIPVGLKNSLVMGPLAKFTPRGKSGLVLSDLVPHLADVADELCLLRAMQADNSAHDLATLQLHTGAINEVRPAAGAWVTYGLGTENRDLPGFVSMQAGGNVRNYGAGFLPAAYQGTPVGTADPKQDPVKFLTDPATTPEVRRRQLDLVQKMNARHGERVGADPALDGMIEAYELAFRMQAKAPEVFDLTRESKDTLALYGVGEKATDRNGRACLLARRLSEAGVRFVQVQLPGWDHHVDIRKELPKTCGETDRPVAALIADLKRRGLLDETLVIFSGEFGRTPWSQDLSGTSPLEKHGREHQTDGFTAWLAGGGVKRGHSHGETDEYGHRAVAGKVHIHDLHATILHLLGLDHEKLTYRHAGRDFRLTDVAGRVVNEIVM